MFCEHAPYHCAERVHKTRHQSAFCLVTSGTHCFRGLCETWTLHWPETPEVVIYWKTATFRAQLMMLRVQVKRCFFCSTDSYEAKEYWYALLDIFHTSCIVCECLLLQAFVARSLWSWTLPTCDQTLCCPC